MADQKLGLPVRTEADADERLQSKIVDSTTPSQGATVDANGDLHTLSKIVDDSGTAWSNANPLPVSITGGAGDEITDYDTASAVASDGTSNHDYTVTVAKTLIVDSVKASASSRGKFEVQVETGVATGVFNTIAVGFWSSSNPNGVCEFHERVVVAAGVIIRVIRTNRDNQAQDLYSTIVGIEI